LDAWKDFALNKKGDWCHISVYNNNSIISEEQKLAYKYLTENQVSIRNKINDEIFKIYPELQHDYGFDDDNEDKDSYMPDLNDPSEMSRVIGLHRVHILDISKDGIAYIGYDFKSWDDEHRTGVLTHTNRVLKIGYGEVASDRHIGRDDAKKAEI
jgi:hypothetical protein